MAKIIQSMSLPLMLCSMVFTMVGACKQSSSASMPRSHNASLAGLGTQVQQATGTGSTKGFGMDQGLGGDGPPSTPDPCLAPKVKAGATCYADFASIKTSADCTLAGGYILGSSSGSTSNPSVSSGTDTSSDPGVDIGASSGGVTCYASLSVLPEAVCTAQGFVHENQKCYLNQESINNEADCFADNGIFVSSGAGSCVKDYTKMDQNKCNSSFTKAASSTADPIPGLWIPLSGKCVPGFAAIMNAPECTSAGGTWNGVCGATLSSSDTNTDTSTAVKGIQSAALGVLNGSTFTSPSPTPSPSPSNSSGSTSCPLGMENSDGLCYPICTDDVIHIPAVWTIPATDIYIHYKGASVTCWQIYDSNNVCPPQTHDAAAVCLKNSQDRGAGKPLHCASDEQDDGGLCYTYCRSGYHGIGSVCWADTFNPDPSQNSYVRGSGKAHWTCDPNTEDNQAGACYSLCPANMGGVGTVCWGLCPAGWNDTGSQCQKKTKDRGAGCAPGVCPH